MNSESRRVLRAALGAALLALGLAVLFGAITLTTPANWIVGLVLIVLGVVVLAGAL